MLRRIGLNSGKKTMKLAITYPHNALLTTVVNALEMFTESNYFSQMISPGSQPPFDISLMGAYDKMDHDYGITNFVCTPFDRSQQDIVVVPAIKAFEPLAFEKNKELLGYIKRQYRNGATVVSICTGGLLLAEAGLLEAKRAATHWAYSEMASNRFPNVHFEFNEPFIDLGDIITSTGAFSSNTLIIYLIEKLTSRELALFTSRMYLTDYSSDNAGYFIPLNLKTNHRDERILKIQDFIAKHYNKDISVGGIAHTFNMSSRNLSKLFKETVGINPSEYIQVVRIKKATELLENSEQNIKEIMYSIGYYDASSFRKVFKKTVGLAPTDYRMKFKRIKDIQLG